MLDAEPLWTIDDVAKFLGISRKTFYQWRYRGYGPKALRLRGAIRYRPADVAGWLDAQE